MPERAEAKSKVEGYERGTKRAGSPIGYLGHFSYYYYII